MIPTFDGNMEIIRRLADEPNDVGGLTAEQLKYEFDKAGELIKTYLNTLLVPSLTADNFPVGELPGISVNTLQAVLLALVGQIQSLAADQSAAADDITELQALHTQDVAALHEELDEIWTAVNELRAAAVAIDPITGLSGVYNVQAALEALQAAIEGGTPPATVPSAPQAFAATAGNAQLALAWTAPASNGGSQITGYQVSTGGTTWTDVGLVTVYALTGLTNGTSYTIYVRAVNGVGVGLAASTTGIPVAPVTVPTAPQNFTATAGDGKVALTWTAPASDGGSPITGYQWTTGASWSARIVTYSATITGLVNGTTYTCQVRAVNAVGTGPAVAASATPASPATVPGEIPKGSAWYPDAGNIIFTWDAPSTGGSPIIRYNVNAGYIYGSSYHETGWMSVQTAVSDYIPTTWEEPGGSIYYLYQVYVRAVNAVGAGPEKQLGFQQDGYISTITRSAASFTVQAGTSRDMSGFFRLHPGERTGVDQYGSDWGIKSGSPYLNITKYGSIIRLTVGYPTATVSTTSMVPVILNRSPGEIVQVPDATVAINIVR
jgi:hypothetical protein